MKTVCPAIHPQMPLSLPEECSANLYSTLALASKVGLAVKNHSARLSLVAKVWKLESSLRGFLEAAYRGLEHPDPASRPATPPELQEFSRTLRALYHHLQSCYDAARSAGLTHSWYMGAPLHSIHKNSDEILDFAEWIDLYLSRDAIEENFARSLQELHQGEVFDLPVFP